MEDHYAIQGVKSRVDGDIHQVDTTTHPRLDINDFSTNPAHVKGWSLYLKALAALKDYAENLPLGYFGVAGIHGYPHAPWMGSTGGEWGYCTHASPLFLPWHRAYVVLFEQRIVEEALKVAEGYDDKEAYLAEARKLRVPYWDWAKDAHLPQAVLEKVAYVQGKSGELEEIQNPLYSYIWKDKSPSKSSRRSYRFKETKRCPDKEGNNQPDVVYEQLSRLAGLRTGVFDTITKAKTYGAISNTNVRGGYAFESVHDNLHGYVGSEYGNGGTDPPHTWGEMGDQGVAAFDPIFWLHHASIDRYYALWQELNPDAVFQPNPSQKELTVSTHLDPFCTNAGGDMWTSAMVQKAQFSDARKATFELGYHYPETSPHLTQEDRQEEVYTAVMNLYSPSATAAEAAAAAAKAKAAEEPRATEEGVEESSVEEPSFAEATEEATGIEEPSFTRATEEAIGENAVEEPSFARATEDAMGESAVEAALEHVDDSGPPSPLLTSLFPFIASLFPILGPLLYFIMFPPGTLTRETYDTTLPTAPAPPESLPIEAGLRREWKVFYEIKRYIVDNNFTLFFFLGDPEDSPGSWSTSPNVVGSYCSFKALDGRCGNCQTHRERDAIVYGEVNLTAHVLSRLPKGIELHDQQAISDWLAGKLHWRLRKDDGTEFTEWKAGCLLVGVESYMEAHPPAFEKDAPREYKLRDIVGVTFDTQKHPAVTEMHVEKGGYAGDMI